MNTRCKELGLFTLFLCATLGATLTAAALDAPLTYEDKPSADKEVRLTAA